MNAPTLFDAAFVDTYSMGRGVSGSYKIVDPYAAQPQAQVRASDPVTSREAAERVKPGNSALVAEIRRVVNAWVTNRGEPIDAFGIARSVEYANRDRWSEASIRTAIARAGLRAVDTEGRSPRGSRCIRYVLEAS